MITGRQVRMARAGLGLSLEDLAGEAGIGIDALRRIEAGRADDPAELDTLRRILDAAGAEFIDEATHVGVRVPRANHAAGAKDGWLRPGELNASNDD